MEEGPMAAHWCVEKRDNSWKKGKCKEVREKNGKIIWENKERYGSM
jgi:hypothetical protein